MHIFLTWLHTTEELKSKGTSAQPIIDLISKILPERIASERWCKKFHKTLQMKHTDLTLLESQILPTTQEQAEDAVVEEVKEEQTEISRLPRAEEVISAQSKGKRRFIAQTRLFIGLRSCFEELQGIANDPSVEMSKRCEKKLIKKWPDFTVACLDNVSRSSVILFNHLATALRVLAKKYWKEDSEEFSPTPKAISIKIGTTAVYKSILFERPIFEQEEGDEQISIPTLPLKGALTNFLNDSISYLAAFLNLLLALAEADPNSTARNVSTATLLASYKASLSLCGKIVALFLKFRFSPDRRCLQLLNILDQSGHSPASTW